MWLAQRTCAAFLSFVWTHSWLTAGRIIQDGQPIRVNTKSGDVEGQVGGGSLMDHCLFVPTVKKVPGAPDVATFFGIPYAEQPTGSLRFAPPQPRSSWAPAVFDATKMIPICPQNNEILPGLPKWLPGKSTQEDCLVLNVWTKAPIPDPTSGQLRPVLVFIHGGAFLYGNGYTQLGCSFYDGNHMAASEGLVVVTLNYRLGALGFLDLPELRKEVGTAGNFGIQDQRLALQWVQQNIAHFGGDPARVTLSGESAGAASVLHHMILPRSRGLFHRAIAESGYAAPARETGPMRAASDRAIVDHIGCSAAHGSELLACLRNASVDEILDAQRIIGQNSNTFVKATLFYPSADGFELPEHETLLGAFERHAATGAALVPMLTGTNLNESALFQCSRLHEVMSAEEVEQEISELIFLTHGKNVTPSDVHELMAQYPVGPSHFPSIRSAVISASSDILFGCTTRSVLATSAAAGSEVYQYVLARSPAFFRFDKCLGVPHIADTFYVFYNDVIGKAMDEGDHQVAMAMQSSWTSFARGGSPGLPKGYSSVEWPGWNGTAQQSFWFDTSPRIEQGYHSAECNVVDKITGAPKSADSFVV